ncbi:restriction endonuclease subunit S [Corallococcus sp. CA049B]|uniref:restriction endonuclease subunit S n=1 Tax=Corallococcus sp. CA049B TaxID=2316730 RepID=UPI000EA327F9|nr:restriction endonuclease subunit S [Corallococcus sp. CA049B]RKG89442.1 restriction endonuclease subunit S [Corallococcus sp. CA049B]
MRNDWVQTTVGDLIRAKGGSIKTGPFGTVLKANEYSTDGVPVISVGEIGYGSFRLHRATPRVPPAVLARLPEYVLKAGDIVFGRKGAVDRSALVRNSEAGWFLGSDGIRLRLSDECDPSFFAYQIQSPATRAWLLQHATGTTMASLNQGVIERIPVVVPPLFEQREMAGILRPLDEKIDLDRRMNQTLEALAQALFRSWFSQFISRPEVQVPVKILLDEGALAIGDGYRAKNSEMADTGLPFVRAGDVSDGFALDGADLLGDEALSKAREKVSRRGDVVFTSKGTVGRFARVTARTAPCVYSPQLCYWRPLIQDRVNPIFLWHWLRSSEFWAQAAAVKGQTDMADYVNLRDQSRMKISLPPIEDQMEIAQVLEPLDERIDHNRTESRTLAALRNMLLPKLLSGESRVRDAAAQLAASA